MGRVQHLHRSTDLGARWEAVSPDLARNDPSKLASSRSPNRRRSATLLWRAIEPAALSDQFEFLTAIGATLSQSTP